MTAPVIEGIELKGNINVDVETIRRNVAASIRRGHPQLRQQPPQPERVCLVGSGPSLTDTTDELVQLLHEGAKLVTVNGAYQWALDHNLHPSAQIIVDARPGNERFVQPAIPRCQYVLCSQTDPAVWDAVEGREGVWIFHSAGAESGVAQDILDPYYLGQWVNVGGGSTVITRALYALRLFGYLRFDLFGVDSCWMGTAHHAFPQPENDADRFYQVTVAPSDAPDRTRTFRCSAWHLKQYEDMLHIIRHSGEQFLLNVHGDGLLAHTLRVNAELATVTEE